MNKISYHLILINSSLKLLADQVDKLCECIEQQINGAQPPVLPHNIKNIKIKKEPQLNGKSLFAEASAVPPSVLRHNLQGIEKPSILDSVYESIKRSRKGIAFVQIQKKTGFNRRQVANAIYKLKEKDMIIRMPTPDPENNANIWMNADESEMKGIELELKFAPIESILLTATYSNLLDADSLTLMPATTASFSLNYNHKYFNFNINGIYRSEMDLLKEDDLMNNREAYAIFNTTLFVNISKNLKLKTSVRNLFDKEYYTYSINRLPGIINRGRTYTVGVVYDF